jgi:hypothetical protein
MYYLRYFAYRNKQSLRSIAISVPCHLFKMELSYLFFTILLGTAFHP